MVSGRPLASVEQATDTYDVRQKQYRMTHYVGKVPPVEPVEAREAPWSSSELRFRRRRAGCSSRGPGLVLMSFDFLHWCCWHGTFPQKQSVKQGY